MYQTLVKNSLCTKVSFRVISQLELFYYRPEENLSRCLEIIVADHNKVTVMTPQPFINEQLNYFKFAFVVLNEFPKVLRQVDNTFTHLPFLSIFFLFINHNFRSHAAAVISTVMISILYEVWVTFSGILSIVAEIAPEQSLLIMLKRSIEPTMELNMFYVPVCKIRASYEVIFILLNRPNLSKT